MNLQKRAKIVIQKKNLGAYILLAVLSIIILQVITMILNLGSLSWVFTLLVIGAAVMLPYAIIMGTVKTDAKTLFFLITIITLDVIMLKYITPALLPTMFSVIP